ncbi:MAG: hypothetical protein KY468_03150 [Armatimonadetes bacterium]|nr:hypothetical protein [Armatimonadota bacterium]
MGLWSPSEARAIALWSKQYGVPCSQCHTVPPALNKNGYAFLERGYRFIAEAAEEEEEAPAARRPQPVLPVNLRAQVRLQSFEDERSSDFNLRAVQLQSGGPLGENTSYLALVYLALEGGAGQADDVFLRFDNVVKNVSAQVGQYLPPVLNENGRRLTPTSPLVYARGTNVNGWFLQQRQLGATLSTGFGRTGVHASIFNGNGTVRQGGRVSDNNDFKDYALGFDQPLSDALTVGGLHYNGHLTVTRAAVPYRDKFYQNVLSADYLTNTWHLLGAFVQGRHNNVDGTGRGADNYGYFMEGRRYFLKPGHQDAAILRWDWADPDRGAPGSMQAVILGYSRFNPGNNVRLTGEVGLSPQGNHAIGELEWHF